MLEKIEEFEFEKVINEFEELSKNAGKVQEETLRKILEENAAAEYLQQVGLDGRTDSESFKQCVPIVIHKDLEPYIQRIMDGDSSPILTGKPIPTLSLSSGTTQGKRKFVPFNDQLFDNTMQIYHTSFAFRNREFPIKNGKALVFLYSSRQFITEGGLPAGTATTNVFRHPKYRKLMKGIQSQSCSPDEVIFGSDFHESLYCHLLCGLLNYNDVQIISSTFAHSLVQAFQTFEQIWENLCFDIRFGSLDDRVTDPITRAAMSKLLKPNPELADLIIEKCSGLSKWYGLIPELFPNAKYVYGIMTGSMEPYIKQLRRYAGWLPLVCADYGASEGWIAANVNPRSPPEEATFTVLPNIGYFEFIPLNETRNGGAEPKPVGLTEVKLGEEYEIILTNFAGLYRYRLGDAVKVMGFHNSTPELKFVCRQNLMLSINIDKNTEKDLQLAVEEASKLLIAEKIDLIDFTSHVDVTKEVGHYVIFWELSGEPDENVLKECCNCLDRSFADAGYVSSRKVGMIGPLELRIVKKETFYKILLHCLSMGNTLNQFKTPRCVGSNNKPEGSVEILKENEELNKNAGNEEFDPEKMIKEFEESSRNAGKIQAETLRKILEENASAEYLLEVGLNGRTDSESFKQCVPVVTHKDLEPYIQRIIKGETTPILTGKPFSSFSVSSGTTQGKRKFIPFNDQLFDNTTQVFLTTFAYRNREFPIKNGKALMLLYSSKPFLTEGGVPSATAATNVCGHRGYKDLLKKIRSQSCSPDEVICGSVFNQSLYCHLLCGLLSYNEIESIYSTFAHSIVQAFETFEQVWEDLCSDIRFGTLNDRVTDPNTRAAMSKLLKPNPDLADMITRKCSGLTNWYGLIPELFPNIKYVYGIMTGAMEPYIKQLRRYAGGVPLVCADYAASEGWIGANINPRSPPEEVTFAVIPNIGYYEFIPLNEGAEPKPVGLADVKLGEEYEIILTNFAGLYRYRLGDTVKVAGFHNSTPELKYVCRQNLMLCINIDKNTENDLQVAVEAASKLLVAEKVDLIDFTSHVDLTKEVGHYVIFWELSGEPDENVVKECCNCLDQSFVDMGYVSSRKAGMIGPLELRIVRKGTFNKILLHCLNMGNTPNQFKTPRYVGSNNMPIFEIVCDNVAKSYFSTAY
uniref:Uncharacterized protein n=1 Tax=Chenopodium quinoa TaxID=63459 RepID=A0A803KZJ8_CHEQI